MIIDKKLILNKLKNEKKFRSDAEFARFLGITPQNLAKWYARNTFNIDILVNVFPEISKSWLLTGEGSMYNSPKNPFSQISEDRIEEIMTETLKEKLIELYNDGIIYPAAVHNRIMAEKDKRIEELQREIWELQKKLKEGGE